MILRNFYNMIVATVVGAGAPVVDYTGAPKLHYHNYATSYAGKPMLYDPNSGHQGNPRMNNIMTTLDNTSYGGVVFGTGTTPPTYDDYKLSGDLITGLTISKTESTDRSDTDASRTVIYTITNGGASDVTIGEVGLLAVGSQSPKETSYGYRYPMMVERTVLNSPVTIPAGGIGQVTYTIRMNYPT